MSGESHTEPLKLAQHHWKDHSTFSGEGGETKHLETFFFSLGLHSFWELSQILMASMERRCIYYQLLERATLFHIPCLPSGSFLSVLRVSER